MPIVMLFAALMLTVGLLAMGVGIFALIRWECKWRGLPEPKDYEHTTCRYLRARMQRR